jgi:beta-fructofuranosidase
MKIQKSLYALSAVILFTELFGIDKTSLAEIASSNSASPLKNATAVWDFARTKDPTLKVHGDVETGIRLNGPDRAASLVRGGDGYIARFRAGYLTTISQNPIQLTGKHASICLRLRDTSRQWNTGLLATAYPQDRLANLIYADHTELIYRWRTTPAWERVRGIQAPSVDYTTRETYGTYGFNGERNDAHDLLAYKPGQWTCSVVRLYEDGKVIVSDQRDRAQKKIDIKLQNICADAFYIGSKSGTSEFLNGQVAEILVYDRPLTEDETKKLISGLLSKWNLAATKTSTQFAIPTNGLLLRLDATQVQEAGNGRISLWKDLSGRGNDMKQALSERMPKRVENALGNLPAIRFHNSQFLRGPAVLAEGDDSFSIVALWHRDHLNGSEIICEQNTTNIQTGRRAALLAQGIWTHNSNNFMDGVLPISAPVDCFGRDGFHDVIIRFADTVVELYVDGVLIDEEWPHGTLHRFAGPFIIGAGFSEEGKVDTAFTGQIDHVAFWNRALTAEEIIALSGGKNILEKRNLEILGPRDICIQYFKPRGKAFAGDALPFYSDGTFHMVYLFDRRHHGSKWGRGAHQFAHLSSPDLIHWLQHPLAVPIARQWENSMGTCCIIKNPRDNKYYAFYTDCGGRAEYIDKPHVGNAIFTSVSEDGIHFKKDFKVLIEGHDCEVFFDKKTDHFYMVRHGTHLTRSKELKDFQKWEPVENFVVRKPGTSNECPDFFQWNGWYYFLLGRNAIWKSRSMLGPWKEATPVVYEGLMVPKVAPFKGNRRIMAGFVSWPGWGGNLALRELLQYRDGSLGVKWPREVVPQSGPQIELDFEALTAGSSRKDTTIILNAKETLEIGMLKKVPTDVYIAMNVKPQPGVKCFGLTFHGTGRYQKGRELRFEPANERVQFGNVSNGRLAKESKGQTHTAADFAITDVKDLDKPFKLEMITKKNRIIDVCIDERRTIINRVSSIEGDCLFFFAKNGNVKFENIQVRPLLHKDHPFVY